jgi:hypothetical protein
MDDPRFELTAQALGSSSVGGALAEKARDARRRCCARMRGARLPS